MEKNRLTKSGMDTRRRRIALWHQVGYLLLRSIAFTCHFLRFLVSVLLLAQFFAVMPIYGITTKSAKELKFTWINLRVLHSAILLFGVAVMIILSLIWATSNTLTIQILGKRLLQSTKLAQLY